MKYSPKHSTIRKFIDYYWVINREDNVFEKVSKIHAYPGIRPELTIFLDGSLTYEYCGKTESTNKHLLSGHIHQDFLFHTGSLNRVVVVIFQPHSLASLLPFIKISPSELMKDSVCNAELVFKRDINELAIYLRNLSDKHVAEELDCWFMQWLDAKATGFVTELFDQIDVKISHRNKYTSNIQLFKELANCSYSTIERHFKKETGMTPKKYQALGRYKEAVEEIYDSQNTDWFYYVEKYGYFDQSHFIKEVRKFTGLTPGQLLHTPNLRSYRPQ